MKGVMRLVIKGVVMKCGNEGCLVMKGLVRHVDKHCFGVS